MNKNLKSVLFTICLSLALVACGQDHAPKKFKLPGQLEEVSGSLYAGPDSIWWLNDSGNEPALFLTDNEGNLQKKVVLSDARNRDWESLAADNSGNIYIGDFGNNANNRQDLRIYIFHPASNRLDSILFSYPDQNRFPPPDEQANFDMEASFWFRDSLHLFSKNRLQKGNYYTKHYVLPAAPGRQQVLLRDSLFLKNRVVTGAAISADGQRVALVAYWFKAFLGFLPLTRTTVFLFEDFPDTHFFRGTVTKKKVPKGLPPTQYESVDFINPNTLIVASEKTIFFKQKARRVKVKIKGSPAVP